MGGEVVEHHADLVRLGVVNIDEVSHAVGEVDGGPMLGDLDVSPGLMDVDEDE